MSRVTTSVMATPANDVIQVDAPGHLLIHDKLFEAVDWDEDVANGNVRYNGDI